MSLHEVCKERLKTSRARKKATGARREEEGKAEQRAAVMVVGVMTWGRVVVHAMTTRYVKPRASGGTRTSIMGANVQGMCECLRERTWTIAVGRVFCAKRGSMRQMRQAGGRCRCGAGSCS